jgi:hypothetical protein
VKKSIFIVAALALGASLAYGDVVGKAYVVKTKPIVRTTAQIMAYENAYGPKLPIRKIKDNEVEHEYYRGNLPSHPGSPAVASWPIAHNDVSVQATPPIGRQIVPNFAVPVNFGGPTLGESGFIPPDSDGDVSLSSVIVAANGRIKSYDRLGNLGSINTTTDLFFAPAAPAGTSDPRVVFDRITKRWFIEIIGLANTDNKICIAISNTEAITPTTTWTFFSFAQNVGGGPSGFADYATLGVDANGVYMGTNRFTSTFQNCDLFAINKASLLGGSLVVTPFRNMCTSSTGPGMFTPWPCTNDDPAATTTFVVGVDNAAFSLLDYRRITFAGGAFSLSANASIAVPTSASPLAMPNATSATQSYPLDALDDRLFYARVCRNRITGDVNVHTASGIRMNSAGVGSTTGDRSGARWYNLGNIFSGSVTLNAAGTVVDGSATPQYCTIPSTAMNGQGHQFVGFSMGNLANSAGVAGAYRLAGDPSVTAPTSITAGVPFYHAQGFTPTASAPTQRWGDYSFTMVDPRDMMSIWSFQEYANANNSWQVRAIKVLAPAPTVSGFTPNNGTQGQTLNVVVTGTGIFDPDATYPDHLAFSFGANIVVNSVTWNSATQATVNVTIGATAATGARTVTLTNPDGQTATGSFTVNLGVKTVTGTLTLQSYAGTLIPGTSFLFELRDNGTNALIETETATMSAGQAFSFTTSQPAGTYKLRIKGLTRFLAKSQSVTLISTGATGLAYTLTNGDANGDNVVGVADFNLLRAAWGGVSPNAPYDVNTDFNGDGVIGVADFNILRASWGSIGDN